MCTISTLCKHSQCFWGHRFMSTGSTPRFLFPWVHSQKQNCWITWSLYLYFLRNYCAILASAVPVNTIILSPPQASACYHSQLPMSSQSGPSAKVVGPGSQSLALGVTPHSQPVEVPGKNRASFGREQGEGDSRSPAVGCGVINLSFFVQLRAGCLPRGAGLMPGPSTLPSRCQAWEADRCGS